MKITFQNTSEANQDTMGTTQYHKSVMRADGIGGQSLRVAKAYKVDLGAKGSDRLLDSLGQTGACASWLSQLTEGGTDREYRILMAHTMSEEDFGRLCRDGYPLRQMKPQECVTILDKIKAEVARSGREIAGYNDDLDLEALSKALGSESLARAVKKSFSRQDIPLREKEVSDLKKAWDMAQSLKEPTDGEYRFLIKSGMGSRIDDIYRAECAGAASGNTENPQYFAEEIRGYYTQAAYDKGADSCGKKNADQMLEEQIDQVIRQAGLAVTDQTREGAAWLLGQSLPLTGADLTAYLELKAVSFPVSEEEFARSAADAVSRGDKPWMGYLGDAAREHHGNLYERANRILEQYSEKAQNLEGKALEDRKRLEEIRMRMTAEVNVKLLRSGFSIDTAPMEELVEALRLVQKQVADAYFPGDAGSVAKYQDYQSTNKIIEELPAMPIRLMGLIREQGDAVDGPYEDARQTVAALSEIYQQGKLLQKQYREAGIRYETMFTTPRADLGDRLEKALEHVDELLLGLGYEPTEENCKAARVLGYNRMEISGKNLEKVLRSLHRVEEVVTRMTPAKVLEMIRDGVNPMEKTLEELTEYLDSKEASFEQQAQDYSHFLYRLEKRGDITPMERESFIGIYRLLHQIEKNHGAAVGGVVKMGAELDFKNLLHASRSLGFSSMDVKLGEDREAYIRLIRGENAIDRQIEAEYLRQEMEEVRGALLTGHEAEILLEKGELPGTVDHLLAASGLLNRRMSPYGKLTEEKRNDRENFEDPIDPKDLWEHLDTPEKFQDSYDKTLAALEHQRAEETLEAESFLDVREKRTQYLELAVARALGEKQEYFLPLEMEGEVARVHVTFRHSQKTKGRVEIRLEQEEHFSLATLELREGRVSGFLQGSDEQEVKNLAIASDIFSRYLKDETPWSMEAPLPVFHTSGSKTEIADAYGEAGAGTNKELYQLTKLWLKAVTQKEVEYEN